jgi:hypothetical protein
MERVSFLVGASIALVATAAACLGDDERYVYTARRFDEVNACFEESYVPIERVVGEGAGTTCPPTCMTVKELLYVSPICKPLPDNAIELEESDPRCAAALEAFRSETICGAEEEEDGGEEEAGEDDGGAEEDAAEET